jgi:hypothetical protein
MTKDPRSNEARVQPPSLDVSPMVVKQALRWVKSTHRRLPNLQGGMWAVGCRRGGEVRGVAIVGRPTARMLPQDGSVLQVLRVAVEEGVGNGCSILYGACAGAARRMGAVDMFTYIHDDESGVSLRAAGWIEDETFASAGGEWSRPSRPRNKTVEPEAKRRYFAPWSAYLTKKRAA